MGELSCQNQSNCRSICSSSEAEDLEILTNLGPMSNLLCQSIHRRSNQQSVAVLSQVFRELRGCDDDSREIKKLEKFRKGLYGNALRLTCKEHLESIGYLLGRPGDVTFGVKRQRARTSFGLTKAKPIGKRNRSDCAAGMRCWTATELGAASTGAVPQRLLQKGLYDTQRNLPAVQSHIPLSNVEIRICAHGHSPGRIFICPRDGDPR